MTDLQDFRDKMSNYKSYREQNPGKTYLDWKKAIQELKHIDIDNDPTYDYKGYYDLNNFAALDMLNKKSDAHFTDNFKTSLHPTFSEESGYSGYINKFNPNGITGGSWGDHSYNLSDSQIANDWDIKNTLDYLSIAENEGISLKYDDKYPVIDDTVIGGVLPEVEVKGYAGGGLIPLLGNKAKLFTQQDLNTMHDLNVNAGAYDLPTSEILHRMYSNGKVKTVPTPGNGFVSNNDPVGLFVVEGVATAPLFNLIGKAALFGAGRMGIKWARSKIISLAMNNSLLEPKKYLDNTYGEVTDYLFDKLHPELNRIGSKDLYKQYLYRMMPASSTSKVYYHGSNSNFLDGFNSAVKGVGSGAPETGSEMYFAELPETILLYVDGINTNIKDNNGFKHWNKLWWQAKEMLGNGLKGNWKSKTITELRLEIPNKRGVFNESHGKLLSQIKSYYNALDMSDKDFAKKTFNIDLGKESFNDWVSKNKAKFDLIWKAKQFDSGVYPVRINTTKPYTEFNQDTYYRDRGVFNPELNDAILSNAANNEFNSNVAVVFNPKDNVNFLGSSLDLKAFKQFVSPNNREYIPISSERNNPIKEIPISNDRYYRVTTISELNNALSTGKLSTPAISMFDNTILNKVHQYTNMSFEELENLNKTIDGQEQIRKIWRDNNISVLAPRAKSNHGDIGFQKGSTYYKIDNATDGTVVIVSNNNKTKFLQGHHGNYSDRYNEDINVGEPVVLREGFESSNFDFYKKTKNGWVKINNNDTNISKVVDENGEPPLFLSELDWSPESWFKLRSDGRYDLADIDALKSHVLEYNKIEQEAKANGTWLKMKDGSTWEGDPRIWVLMLSKSFINNANKTSNLMKNNSGDIIIQEHLGRPNITTFDSKKYATTGMGHNKNGGGTYSFPKELYDADAGKYTKDAYIRLYKRNNNDLLPEPYYIYSFNRNTYKANLGDTKINPDESFDSIITPQQFTTGEKVNPNDIYSDDILTNFDMLTSRNPNLLKSVIGNNGDFNLNNSNIYKSLFPIGIGLGATSLYNKK